MEIFKILRLDMGWVLIGALAAILLLFLLVIILFVKNSKLNKRYRKFMSGEDGKSLEKVIQKRFDEIDSVNATLNQQQIQLAEIKETLMTAFQKVGIIKYDAFREMGGKLSFAIALLNDENSGFIINSMHSSREGCYTYIKEVIHGESFVVLAEEEQEALNKALSAKQLIK